MIAVPQTNNREELVVEDREVVESKNEEKYPDFSLISRVSNSQEDLKFNDKSPLSQDHTGEPLLGLSQFG